MSPEEAVSARLLAAVRLRAGMSTDALAHHTGLSQSDHVRLEHRGLTLRVDTAWVVCRVCRVPFVQFFRWWERALELVRSSLERTPGADLLDLADQAIAVVLQEGEQAPPVTFTNPPPFGKGTPESDALGEFFAVLFGKKKP